METINNTQKPQNRPVFLTVLCILTFIQTGFSVLTLLFTAVKGPATQAELQQDEDKIMEAAAQMRATNMSGMADLLEKISDMSYYTNSMFYTMLFMNMLTIALGFGGALLMWKGRKIGFHSYIIYNIVAILTVYVAVPIKEVPAFVIILNVIFSSVFIFMYSRNLKWMK